MSAADASRTLVLCFDGTANHFDGDNTNVVKLFELLKKDDHKVQLCYYQPGVGTYLKPGSTSHWLEGAAKLLDQAVAWYLDTHVTDGYQFIMRNYRPGDRICLFGFSRGAYIARALAGFLYKTGLLPRDNFEQVTFAYRLYKRTDAKGLRLCERFKRSFCRDVKVDFVGVWDTVASVGMLRSKSLPFTAANQCIKTFRHALSLDEHRVKFKPNLYHRMTPEERKLAEKEQIPERRVGKAAGTGLATTYFPHISDTAATLVHRPFRNSRKLKKKRRESTWSEAEIQVSKHTPDPHAAPRRPGGTDVLEVWFAGCHADVGGGAVSDDTPALADIALRWMVREVMAAQCGVLFDSDAMRRMKIPLDGVFAASPRHAPSRELALDREEAGLPIHDEMRVFPLAPVWWIAEMIPFRHMWQDGEGGWHHNSLPNFFKGRRIPDIQPNFHISVKERMHNAALHYKPKAKWKTGTEVYVE
ncbi:hypothetical protein PUNSTDRAFT_61007 [Punctularia strigosozonata HHB-11173 SS5]|uniref:uncharacterized protein n=1 Tax=Punctularia strigosozonata (strain HHB-11173) TaxID=741275 RepID=UPI0004417469|nr:uncharacterized protein PUNSTDRAFT_61007 [Punctularia strigosozonata HHB-11173 SS5]EIN12817.1 hypothetical protein PUNSTDRAFT_61007 [Punctularia strigosozonata HHB-11173 SS5]